MNQKEYELIADILDNWYSIYAIDYAPFRSLVVDIADALEQYQSFNRTKFMARIGIPQ